MQTDKKFAEGGGEKAGSYIPILVTALTRTLCFSLRTVVRDPRGEREQNALATTVGSIVTIHKTSGWRMGALPRLILGLQL